MNCPGQDATSPFFATLKGSKQWLDPEPARRLPLAYSSQFKCYDGGSQAQRIQPAPYDGLYSFPTSVRRSTRPTGKAFEDELQARAAPTRTTGSARCCRPASTSVEVIVPPGYQL